MNKFKEILYFALGGSFLIHALTLWLGPKYLIWYFTPPVNSGLHCSPSVEWALNQIVKIQLIGAVAGLALGLVIKIVLDFKKTPQEE
jgi:hypothetical protein